MNMIIIVIIIVTPQSSSSSWPWTSWLNSHRHTLTLSSWSSSFLHPLQSRTLIIIIIIQWHCYMIIINLSSSPLGKHPHRFLWHHHQCNHNVKLKREAHSIFWSIYYLVRTGTLETPKIFCIFFVVYHTSNDKKMKTPPSAKKTRVAKAATIRLRWALRNFPSVPVAQLSKGFWNILQYLTTMMIRQGTLSQYRYCYLDLVIWYCQLNHLHIFK